MIDKEINSEIMVQNKQCGTRSQVKKLYDGIDAFRWSRGAFFCKTLGWADLPTLKDFSCVLSSPYQFTEVCAEDIGKKPEGVYVCVCKVHICMYIYAPMYTCVYMYVYVYTYKLWTFNDTEISKLTNTFIYYI